MFHCIGGAIIRAPLLVVAAWIAVAGLCLAFAPTLSRVGTADEASFLAADVESMAARGVAAGAFPSESAASTATLVLFRESGLTDADRAYRDAFAAWLTGDAAPSEVRDRVLGVMTAATAPDRAGQLQSADGTTELVTVRLNVVAYQRGANDAVAGIRAHAAASAPAGLEVHVTGSAGIGTDYLAAIVAGTDRTTIVTVLLVVLILLTIYRAPLAALVPLLTIGVAYLVARGALGWVAASGVKVSTLIESFIVVLVFGVGTDYTIFLVSRYREELAWTPDGGRSVATRLVAARQTVGRIGSVIAASAATVVVGLTAMAVARFGLIQTTGPSLALAIVVTFLAGLTLAPALLVVFGPALFWPRHPRPMGEEPATSAWARLAATIVRRPVLIGALVVGGLALPVVLLPEPAVSFDMLRELPAGADARVGFDRVAEHMDRGRLMPIVAYLDVPAGDVTSPAGLATIESATTRIAGLDGVTAVSSLVAPAGGSTDALRPSTRLRAIAGQVRKLAIPGAIKVALATPGVADQLGAGGAWLAALGRASTTARTDPSYGVALAAADRLGRDLAALAAGASGPVADAATVDAIAAAGELATASSALADVLAASPADDWLLPTDLPGDAGAAMARLLAGFASPDGHAARIVVVARDDPYSADAFATVARIRAALAGPAAIDPRLAGPGSAGRFVVGGVSAEFADVDTTMAGDFVVVAALTVAGILLVLALLLRSLVAPIYLVATVLLSYAATLRLAGAFFRDVAGQAGINTYLPLIVFVLLVALGSDYNIFVTSRIREESATGDLRTGIRTASARTGTVVTSAGVILAGTFGSLMAAPLAMLFQVGFAVALGVLVDTFVVRSILVPALAAMFGEWSWWPAKRRRPG